MAGYLRASKMKDNKVWVNCDKRGEEWCSCAHTTGLRRSFPHMTVTSCASVRNKNVQVLDNEEMNEKIALVPDLLVLYM